MHARDPGVTFIEILVAIVLIGTVIVGILAAMRTSIVVSANAQEAAKVETALLNASDRVSRAPLKCAAGGYDPFVQAAIATWEGEGSAVATVTHLSYDADGGAFAPSSWIAGACPTDPTAQRVQRVEITITGPDGRVTRSIEVIKSKIGGTNV
ncbi:type IV pilus modification PilV family protein [Ilumatobacter fluminis]|uniref:type IV pilus modification PilV family protein n=1 Tax=Ilumatobacter fluminis TaxID=467091 RepID=UPI00105D9DED|nr:type II secretion system protein [Ilumatobacter fluminis]